MNKKYIYGGIAAVAIAAAAAINVTVNSQDSNELSAISLANVEALAGESGNNYKWSTMRDCPGWGTGDYSACEANGTGNSCNTPGDTTCTCGTNCK
jgi:hypothetical protein